VAESRAQAPWQSCDRSPARISPAPAPDNRRATRP
jgi:hypothetical protein